MKMTPGTMSALLGRPLTDFETQNFDLYLRIARESLDDLLCMNLCIDEETRTYDAREGYSTVFTDIFQEIEEVKVNGKVVTNYSVRQWDRRNGSWYNSLVFDCPFKKSDEVEVTAIWGFYKMPADLQALLAGLFDLVTKKNKFDGTIQSKQVEDFRISFNTDADIDTEFALKHRSAIKKYGLCDIGQVIHGNICVDRRDQYYVRNGYYY